MDQRDRASDDPAARIAAARALAPGAARIAALESIEERGLSPELQLELVELWEESDCWLQARKQRPLAELADAPAHDDEDWSRWEVAACLRLSEGTAHDRLRIAKALCGRLRKTLEALESARITVWQARAIVDGVALLSDADAAVVEDQLLRQAPELTLAETRRAADKAVMAIDPDAAERRRKERRRARRVEHPRSTSDGMAGVWIEGPIETLAGFFHLLTLWARELKKAGLVDTLDQGRFDALMALVLAAAYGEQADTPPAAAPVPAYIGLLVDATTLGGYDDNPAEIPGYGPVTAQVARRIAAGKPDDDDDPDDPDHPDDRPDRSSPRATTWKLLPIDPRTGWLARPPDPTLDKGRTSRFATPKQKRFIADRDRVCFFRGCNQPAERRDVDHRNDWGNGGRTDVDELGSGCGHHNRVTKTNGWTTVVGPEGTATLVSPLGRRYPIRPYRYWDVGD